MQENTNQTLQKQEYKYVTTFDKNYNYTQHSITKLYSFNLEVDK